MSWHLMALEKQLWKKLIKEKLEDTVDKNIRIQNISKNQVVGDRGHSRGYILCGL